MSINTSVVGLSLVFLFIITVSSAQPGGQIHCPQTITCKDKECSDFHADASSGEWQVLDSLKATTYLFKGVEIDNGIANCELYESGTLGITVVNNNKFVKPACDKNTNSACPWNGMRCLAENTQACAMIPQ